MSMFSKQCSLPLIECLAMYPSDCIVARTEDAQKFRVCTFLELANFRCLDLFVIKCWLSLAHSILAETETSRHIFPRSTVLFFCQLSTIFLSVSFSFPLQHSFWSEWTSVHCFLISLGSGPICYLGSILLLCLAHESVGATNHDWSSTFMGLIMVNLHKRQLKLKSQMSSSHSNPQSKSFY